MTGNGVSGRLGRSRKRPAKLANYSAENMSLRLSFPRTHRLAGSSAETTDVKSVAVAPL